MAQPFEHLPLVLRRKGVARFPQAPVPPTEEVTANRAKRGGHAARMGSQARQAVESWQERQQERKEMGLPPIDGVPLLLRLDRSLDVEDLRTAFDFEIVSEEPDGFVIVASEDLALSVLNQKLQDFIGAVRGSAKVAGLLDLREDPDQSERLKKVLSERLYEKWPTMRDEDLYLCDLGVATAGTVAVPKRPARNPRWSVVSYFVMQPPKPDFAGESGR